MKAPTPTSFDSRLRGLAVTARVGTWLGISFVICFATGLISHYAQNLTQPIPFPTAPSWGYRATQGLHVISGTAAVPLLLVKLWVVYPKLFERPPRDLRRLPWLVCERASIAILVATAIFLLVSGIANAAQWYPWAFSFRRTHYAVAWIAIGALLIHVAVKILMIRQGLAQVPSRDASTRGLSRRGLLRTTGAAVGVAVLATAGNTVPWLRSISVFAVRSGAGPQGVPINKSAAAAGVEETATSADYRLTVAYGDRSVSLTRTQLTQLPQHAARLPIACVEGWSANADWSGVRLRDLLDLVETPRGRDIVVTSLQQQGAFKATTLQSNFAEHEDTLLALAINGETLSLDHGFPARLIAPNRPGVLQTKWVTRLEVAA